MAGCTPAEARDIAADLRAPFIGKPLWADGRPGSHGLLVIEDEAALEALARGECPSTPVLPLMLQQYVDHGGCLFKACLLENHMLLW